jgi:spore maturation protein CgeB
VDQEVVSYSSVDECREKMQYLLANEQVRQKIAAKGQQRTLKDHAASRRAVQLQELIEKRNRS